MRKLLNNPFMVGLLVAAALVLAFWPQLQERLASASKGGTAANPIESGRTPEFMTSASGQSEAARIRQSLAAVALTETDRDIFKYAEIKPDNLPPAAEDVKVTTEAVHLSAIWSQSGASLALLNDRITAVGDHINDIEVMEISSHGVWLQQHAIRVFLAVGQTHAFAYISDNLVQQKP